MILLLSIGGFYWGCKKDREENGKWYIIPKGKHETVNPLTTRNQNLLVFRAEFNESAKYTAVVPENQADVNKLFGLSDCGTHHQTNSARFGWRWFNDSLEILAYCYVNGVRIEPVLINKVELNTLNIYRISFEKDRYIFSVNEKTVIIPKVCNYSGLRYLLYPYFGGDEPAPHDIKIWIEELDKDDL